MPNYEPLFKRVGVVLKQDSKKVFFGAYTSNGVVGNNPQIGSPAYKAGLNAKDKIVAIDNHVVGRNSVNAILTNYKIGDEITIQFSRYNQLRIVKTKLIKDPSYSIMTFEKAGLEVTPEMLKNRKEWLDKK